MRHMGEWHRSEMSKVGGMSFATQGALAKVLHPDTRKQATEAQIDEACRLFTAWKAEKTRRDAAVRNPDVQTLATLVLDAAGRDESPHFGSM
jgi:hypothetical protein